MNEVIQCLCTRRSVRAFQSKQVEESQLAQILQAGTFAPSGRGMQATKMVVVQDPKTIAQMSSLNAAVMGSDADPFYGAPTVIVVFADRNRNTYIEDGSLVLGNLMNAAHAVGVDSCWIHRAREVFESEQGKTLKRQWGIGDDYVGIGNCILGYGAGDYPQAKPRKEDQIVRV